MPTRPPQHRPTWWKPYKEDAKQVKRRHARRALATNSTAWRRLRAVHLAGEPLCRECAKTGRVTAATDVDHIDGDDSNNAPDNLQSLCHACHSSKTARENGGFGRAAEQEDPFDGLLLDPDRGPERDGPKLNGQSKLNGQGSKLNGGGQSRGRSGPGPFVPLSSRFRRI